MIISADKERSERIPMARTSVLIWCLLTGLFLLPACAGTAPDTSHPGITWVRTSAEYDAIALSTYRSAQDALEEKISDRSWSALPYQTDAANLPIAVILDVDETVVSNVEFQSSFIPPFSDDKLDAWNRANKAVPVSGVVSFAVKARELGATLFFVTNRPCMPRGDDPCPQKSTTVQDINEAGIPVTADYVMLSSERPGWSKEKKIRRDFVAEDYRVIMLVGDDLGDFIPCTRKSPTHPCTERATIASRAAATLEYQDYWGNGWYILPNPMHGSWASVE